MLDELVKVTDLPRDFLAKVFQKLVHGGVLKSAKGRGGVFILAKPAYEITLINVVEAIDGPQLLDRARRGVGLARVQERACTFHHPHHGGGRQVLLARKVLVQAGLGDADLGGHLVDRHGLEALLGQQAVDGGDVGVQIAQRGHQGPGVANGNGGRSRHRLESLLDRHEMQR